MIKADGSTGLRVGVIASRLSGQQTGVARYLLGVINSWAEHPPPEFASVTLYSPRPLATSLSVPDGMVELCPSRSPLPPLVWENIILPVRLRSSDVLLAPSFTMPVLAPVPPTVLVMYDAHQLLRPSDFGRRGRYLLGPAMRRSARRAAVITTISQESRQDLVQALGVDPDSVEITPGGVDRRFHPGPVDRSRLTTTAAISPAPYALFVGKMSKRRNIGFLIDVAGELARRGLIGQLVLVGYNSGGWPIDELVGRAGLSVRHLEQVSDEMLVELYNGAELFLQAPLHETFSLPLLEALACGVPAVTADLPALRQTAGTAATYINPEDRHAAIDRIAALLTDDSRRQRSRQEGPARAAAFGWPSVADRFTELLVRAARPG